MLDDFFKEIMEAYNPSYDTDEITNKIAKYPWKEARKYIYQILLDNSKMKYWDFLITIICHIISENKEKANELFDKDYLLALLDSCQSELDEDKYGYIDDELLWFITTDLENLGYLDDYELSETAKKYIEDISQIRKK